MIEDRLIHRVYQRYSHHKTTNKQKNATCIGMIGEISLGKIGNYNWKIGSITAIFNGKYCWVGGYLNFSNWDNVYTRSGESGGMESKLYEKSYWKFFGSSTKECIHPTVWPLSHHVTLLAHGRVHFLQNLVDGNIKPLSIDLAKCLIEDNEHYTTPETDLRAAWYSFLRCSIFDFYKIKTNKDLLTDKNGKILPLDDVQKLFDDQQFVLQETIFPLQVLTGALCPKTKDLKALSITYVLISIIF